MVKIVFGQKKDGDATSPPPAAASSDPPAPTRKPSMKISFKPQTPTTESAPSLPSPDVSLKPRKTAKTPATEAPAPLERKPTILKLGKRARDIQDNGNEELPAKRQVKPTERAQSLSFKLPLKPVVKTPTLKLNTKLSQRPSHPSAVKLKLGSGSSAVPQSATTPLLKLKTKGKIPKRDPGVGYDSEDEDAEADPVLEQHFILRMLPGDDCTYLRNAIAESSMKHKPDGTRALGPDVWMKFFDKEGRRGVVSVRGHLYAAALLDLPCIVESHKSWDRKSYYKTSDICQILLVLGRVQKEEDAKTYAVPPEVDWSNHQYPHGLTPPMRWVRKRRFRPRINRRHIERVEADVEEWYKKEEQFEQQHGRDGEAAVTLEWIEGDENGGDGEYDEEMDAEGEEDELQYAMNEEVDENVYFEDAEDMEPQAEENEIAEEELEAMMFEGENTQDLNEEGEATQPHLHTQSSDPSLLQASPDTLLAPITPATGTSITSADEATDEESDEDEAASEEDEEERAQREERAQLEAEIDDIRKEIAQCKMNYNKQTNVLLKNKAKGQLEKLEADLQVKLSGLGLEEDDLA